MTKFEGLYPLKNPKKDDIDWRLAKSEESLMEN